MKLIRPISNYLKNNARKNLALAILCISITLIILVSYPSLLVYPNMGLFGYSIGVFSVIPLILGVLYWRKYYSYKLGYDGEKQVAERLLKSEISDDYHLINDVVLAPYDRGNIDHVILSPNGVFAIETKNHRGKITCYGDEWLIRYRGKNRGSTEREFNFTLGSPSAQARNSALRIKSLIDSLEPLKNKRVWVQGIVVFPNKDAILDRNELPINVKVFYMNELPNYLRDYVADQRKELSLEEIELIEKEILQQAK